MFYNIIIAGCLASSIHHRILPAGIVHHPGGAKIFDGHTSTTLLFLSQQGDHIQTSFEQDIEDLLVEPLSLLTKESLYCFRSPNNLTSGACTVECKRIDKKPLGWGLLNGTTKNNEDCRRRCFAFTTRAQAGKKYEGPIFVHVREIPFSYGKLGGSVWMASIALSQYLSMNPSLVQNKRILELGSGVGLVGITTSKLGAAHVTMSEYGSVDGVVEGQIMHSIDDKRLIPSAMITNLQFNVNLNHQQDTIFVQHIDWYDYLAKKKSTERLYDSYDLIVGSDLINWEDDVEALIATLQHYMRNKITKALLCSQKENRKGLPLLLKRLQEEFQNMEMEEFCVQHYETHPILLIKFSL